MILIVLNPALRPVLATGGLRISLLLKLDWNEFLLQRVRIGYLYFFQNHFYEDNKHAFVKLNIFFCASMILFVKFSNSIEQLMQNIHGMHYSKVRNMTNIRNQYNQAPHLTQDTTSESDKTQ